MLTTVHLTVRLFDLKADMDAWHFRHVLQSLLCQELDLDHSAVEVEVDRAWEGKRELDLDNG